MMSPDAPAPAPAARRPGFTLVEVILAVGVIGIAIASLVGILTSTFQQVDDVLQTNRALTAAQGVITALDNPRSILRDLSATGLNNSPDFYLPSGTDPDAPGTPSTFDNTNKEASNFEIAYKLLNQAKDADSAVWLYVYERNVVRDLNALFNAANNPSLNINANPALIEVVRMTNDTFPPDLAAARSVIGAPMRVRLTLSRLLVGQRVTLDTTTGEPTTATYAAGSALDADPNKYALAHLPIVAEFFPHDYTPPADFKAAETQPVLTQTIILNR